MATNEVRTTMRLDPETHKIVRGVCGLTGETLSEFIARTAKAELDRLMHERQQQHDETAFLLREPNGSILLQRIENINQGKVIERELLPDED